MKRILITGANSYIGTSFERYMGQYDKEYEVDTVDMIDGTWREKDFSVYDVVFHVAGIAHQKETKENKNLYYKVNRDLAIETAKKAKNEGVKQFIFLSSMSVYGKETGVITRKTTPNPKSHYGRSKLQAEEELCVLKSEQFLVCILRPPMVYGEGCKGNYQMLVRIAEKLSFFANYKNKRSMIHIDGLSKAVKEMIDARCEGVFFPQDEEYRCTCEMIREIAQAKGKNFRLLKILNPFVWGVKIFTKKGKKAFGDLMYKMEKDGE